jgi:hypothetical protein
MYNNNKKVTDHMNAQTSKAKKPITPDKASKLLASVISKLMTGDESSRKRFYEALRKLDRGENPFISFIQICTNYFIDDGDKNVALLREVDELQKAGFNINPELMTLFEDVFSYSQRPIYLPSVRRNCNVVMVRITDILKNEEERNTFTYSQFIDKAAEEFDLYPCDLFNGLRAISTLNPDNQTGSYFIGLPTPLVITGLSGSRIPYIEIGRRGPGGMVGPIHKTIYPQIVDQCSDPNTAHPSSAYTLTFGHIFPNQKRMLMVKQS